MSEELQAIRCPACGGSVMAKPSDLPRCVFCGNDASELIPFDPERVVETPQDYLPFAVGPEDAADSFRTFATSSFWYPTDLRSAQLTLRQVLLPCWIWSGDVETHWTGLARSASRSGKRPVGGQDACHFEQVLVPSSKTLTLVELSALGGYDESKALPFEEDAQDVPYEIGEVTRSIARGTAQDVMALRHRALIEAQGSASQVKGSSVCTSLEGRPGLVPVYIGVYRYKDQGYRFLVNGQTAVHCGKAPLSWFKITLCFAVVGFAALALVGIAASM